MHLTVADLSPRDRRAAADLADVCRLHARVRALTDPQPADGQPRVLWAHLPGSRLAIRSPQPIPDGRWPPGYLSALTCRPWTPPPAGPVTAVCVINPVRRSSCTPGREGRVTATPVADGQIADWLTERLAVAGINTTTVDVTAVRTVSGSRHGARVSHRVAVCKVAAEVVDPAAAADLAAAGLGRARAYGCGLTAWWQR